MNRERITISLLTEYSDIIDHLHAIKSERSISSYVRHLIRQDMLGNPTINNLDQLADKIASKICNGNLPLSSSPQIQPTEKK